MSISRQFVINAPIGRRPIWLQLTKGHQQILELEVQLRNLDTITKIEHGEANTLREMELNMKPTKLDWI